MLEYSNILTSKDKEVRDPVSGYSYPMSVNDMHAEEAQKRNESQQRSMLTQLLSLTK